MATRRYIQGKAYTHFTDLVLRGTLGNFLFNSIDDSRICERAEITELIALTGDNLAHDTAHDLSGSGLGEVWNDEDLLWSGEGPDDLPDLEDELLNKGSLIFGVIGESAR